LIKNSISGVIQLIFSTILVFISIRLFINYLGSEAYGVFAIIGLIGNLNVFTNLGINQALIIHLSEYGKSKIADHYIIVSCILSLLISVPISIIGITFNKFVLFQIFNISQNYFQEGKILYIYLIISNNILLFGQVFTAILDSQQKIYLTNLYQMVYNSILNGLLIIILLLHYGLKEAGLTIFLSSTIWIILIIYSSLKSWGKLYFEGWKNNFFELAKKQVLLGSKVYLSNLIVFFYEPLTKILISHLIGLKEVGFFDIALKLRNQIWGLIAKVNQPLLPLFSQIRDNSKIRLLVHDLEQKTCYIVVPSAIIFYFIAKSLIKLWIGINVDIISNSVVLITNSYLIFSATMIPNYIFLMAKGHAEKTIYIQLSNVTFNIIIIYLFYSILGYYAFIAANTFAILISFFLMLYYQVTLLNSYIFDNYMQIIKLIFSALLIFCVSYLINSLITNDIEKIIVLPIVVFFITLFIYRITKLFNKDELSRYLGSQNKLSKTIFKILLNE
jgi:O-antigen/teichoic acid export membrane protein